MRPLEEARRDVLAAVPAMPSSTVSLSDALGRVTSRQVVAGHLVPPFANSAMDGFAVRAGDLTSIPVELSVVEDVPAGSVPTRAVGSGEPTRIMTGAPMPAGADTVVMVESTEPVGAAAVRILEAPEAGTNVRPAGGDVAPGDVLVDRGVRLDGRHLGSIASVTGSVDVTNVPTVAILSTGDEVVPPDTRDLAPGMIRDTNRIILEAVLRDLRVPVLDLGIVGDDMADLRNAYRRAAAGADIIVSTGGVSMGDYDFVKAVLGETGSVQFWRVAMQPAKPFAFGSIDGVPLFGLPGNPVSTFVAFEQFVRPALLHMMGATRLLRPRIEGIMGEDVTTAPEKEVFLRVMLADDGGRFIALRSGGQGSNILSALAAADAFAVVPVGVGSVSAGEPVTLEMFRWNESRAVDV